MQIHTAICNIMSEIGAIEKTQKNQQQGFMYRGIDTVMNALQPLFVKHKVYVVPEMLEHTREERQSKQGSTLIYSICKMKYTFYTDDGSNISAVVIGEGMDSGDKATNKAMAIAMKYACFQVFCIPTEEMKDPDSESHELKGKETPKQEPKKQEPVDDGGDIKATKEEIKAVFSAGKARKDDFPDFDMFKHIDELADTKQISTKWTYADKEKTKINWTKRDISVILESLEVPF